MMAALCLFAGAAGGCGAGKDVSDGTASGGTSMGGALSGGGKDVLYSMETEAEGAWEPRETSDAVSGELAAKADMTADADVMPGEYGEPEFSEGDIGIGEEDEPGNIIEPKAGLLTAGEWRDNENWGFFANLVQTGRFSFDTFGIAPYERVVVEAVSGGAPVRQARVQLYTSSGSAISTAVTGPDGKAYLYYNLHGEAQEAGYVVLTKPDGSEVRAELSEAENSFVTEEKPGSAQQEENADGGYGLTEGGNRSGGQQESKSVLLRSAELRVEAGAVTEQPGTLDVMFVFDTTGSMGDELLYLQKEFEDIAGQTADQNTRFSVNFYRDEGDEYVVRSNPFSYDIDEVSALINAEYADGGGDYEEAVDRALLDAVSAHEWREDAVKLMFLILDAPPHDTEETAANLDAAVNAASAQGIRIIPIASSGVDEKTEGLLRSLAMITGGTYTFLTDDSGIGESHLEPTVGAYTVEPLNELIIRLIREYCGK